MKSDEDFFREDEGIGDDGQRRLAAEVIGRVFLWVADAKTLDECGFRSIVALACVRPDLFEGATLEDLGFRAGRQRQAVWKMRRNFRQTTGF